MIHSFKDFLTEENKEVYFTFGRMNPPTIGHEKLLDKLSSAAGKNPYFVFVSQSQDKNKNPLSYSSKVKYVRKMFPKHARKIMINKNIKTFIDAMVSLYDQGYKSITMVVGSDRVREFDVLLNKYNGVKIKNGFYNFKTINVISAGERDPDADDISGMSASKQRKAAKDNDFVSFSQGVPSSLSTKETKKMFNDIRSAMGLAEEKEFKRHISLNPVSEQREKYVKGDLFNIGDSVRIKETSEFGKITWLGSNYVIVETQENKAIRRWLDSVEKVEEKKEIWDKPMPDSKKKGSLSKAQIALAKRRAKNAGRPYPNMVDNIAVSREEK